MVGLRLPYTVTELSTDMPGAPATEPQGTAHGLPYLVT